MLNNQQFSQPCFDAASRYLSYRPRSELELKMRLRKRGFDENSINKVISILKEKMLVNDYAFAMFWKANRDSFNPRSRSMLKRELRQKGISPDIITRVVDELDDYDSAYRAAIKRARSLLSLNYESFRHKCGDYLRRRGYNYEVIRKTVNKLWQEIEEGTSD